MYYAIVDGIRIDFDYTWKQLSGTEISFCIAFDREIELDYVRKCLSQNKFLGYQSAFYDEIYLVQSSEDNHVWLWKLKQKPKQKPSTSI